MTDKTTNPPVELDRFREEVRARLEEIGNPQLSAAFALLAAALPMPTERTWKAWILVVPRHSAHLF
uniref:Uncharacterized protein n=1 Tax=Candidatus Kentrum sp. DK TaxID=2126562 RepID=A0A450SKN4_9GAMM|nr:MAG: hypothetical protein BECKDK2373B_GA0170837_104524 [Candidatus Kentron sp. DK]